MNFKSKELLTAITNENAEIFLAFFFKHKSKKSSCDFKDALSGLSIEEINVMWGKINILTLKYADSIIKATEDNLEEQQLFQAAIDLAQFTLDENLPSSDTIFDLIIYWNSILLRIPEIYENVRNKIVLMSEKLLQCNYVKSDNVFIYNTFIYLLKRSLKPKATKKDVKRFNALYSYIPQVYAMDDIDKEEIWELLKSCVKSVLHTSLNDGQKFITVTLTLDTAEVSNIHDAIMKKLSSCSKNQAICYGKAYYEAWVHSVKTENESLKDELESCIHNIILNAIKKQSKPVICSLRKILNQFHSQKKETYVAKMLYELYRPILWRYLKHPDGLIRAHTAQLFLDVFPLEDPYHNLVAADLELNEQFIFIKELLVDDFPIVRSTTVARLCVSMSTNWEIFPEDMLKTYFKIITNDLSLDSSSSEVRAAVAKGLKALLENPLTICTLRVVLPKVKHLFHDVSDSVRIAFCSLLLKLKQLCAIKYFEIVNLDELLARLEEDSVIAKMIVNLISNSFFPKGKTAEEWLHRCSSIIKNSQNASRFLFLYMSSFISPQSVVKFICKGVSSIYYFVKESAVQTTKTDHLSLGEVCGFDDPLMLMGYIDGFTIIWLATYNKLKKPENKLDFKKLVGKLKKYLSELELHFQGTKIFPSIAYFSSFMSSSDVPCLSSLCFIKLKDMTEENKPYEWKTLLRCLCNQGQEAGVIDLLTEWIEPEIEKLHQPALKKRKGIRGKIMKQSKHLLAIKMYDFLISEDKLCQKTILKSQSEKLINFLNIFPRLQQKIVYLHHKVISDCEKEFVQKLFLLLVKISTLLHVKNDMCCSVTFVDNVISWTENILFPLAWPSKNEIKERKSKKLGSPTFVHLVSLICKDLCTVTGDIALLGMIDINTNKYIHFAMNLLNTENGPTMLLLVTRLLGKHIYYGAYLSVIKKQNNIFNIIPDCLKKIILLVRDNKFLENMSVCDIREVQYVLSSSLQLIQQHEVIKEGLHDIILCFIKNVIFSITESLSENWESIQKNSESFSKIQISKYCSFLLAIISNRQKILFDFLNLLNKHLKTHENNLKSWIACCVLLYQIYEVKIISKNLHKEINLIKITLNKLIFELQPLDVEAMNELLNNESLNSNRKSLEKMSQEKLSFNVHCHLEIKRLINVTQPKAKEPEKGEKTTGS